ncbi:MAG: hypothetical protein WBP26_00345 [Candidatus Saccharimonadales bacterium]
MNDLAFDVTEKDVQKLQALYKNQLGIDLDYETAYRKAHLLLRQMELVYQPLTKQQATRLNNENEDKNGSLRAATGQ